MSGILFLGPQPAFADPNLQTIHSNATITTDGYTVVSGYGTRELLVLVNITAAPTGTNPSLTFTIQDVDPTDNTTVIAGTLQTLNAITNIGTATYLYLSRSSAAQVSWTVGGTAGPTFTGVNVSVIGKVGNDLISNTSSDTIVASSATSVTILAANNYRLGASIVNNSNQILYLKLGTSASSTSYSVRMVANAYFEVPYGYTGIITGAWASVNGNAQVTELTA